MYSAQVVGLVLEDNEKFCKTNTVAHKTFAELIDLVNDAIDYTLWIAGLANREVVFSRSAMMNYMFSALEPLSNGILLDFLAGNLPACFMQLRILIEQLAKCFNADSKYSGIAFFQDRLIELEKEMNTHNVTMWKMIESLDEKAAAMWGRLSEYWIHMRSFKRIVDAVTKRGVPSYALIIPMTYDDTECPDISELGEAVTQYRTFLKATVASWKSQNPQL